MWDKIIDHILMGSPWAIIIALAIAMVILVKTYRKDISSLVTEKEQLYEKLEELRDKYETKVDKLQEQRLKEAVAFNNEYNAAMEKSAISMNNLAEVVKAMHGAA